MAFLNLEAITRFTDKVNENHQQADLHIKRKLAIGEPVASDELDRLTLDGVDMGDVREAALCLAVLLRTSENVRGMLGIKNKPGPKKRRKLDQTIHSPEFGIVMAIEAKEISYTDGENTLMRKFDIDRTTAQRFIAERRDAAKNALAIRNMITRKINI